MSAILFMDTETTGLSLLDDIWEFGAIRREGDGTETEHHLFIQHDPDGCRQLSESFLADHNRRFPKSGCASWHESVYSRMDAAHYIHGLVSDRPHIVGAVPNFDTERLALLLERHGCRWGGHYHLIDAENLAVGYLAGFAQHGHAEGITDLITPPWDSDDLSRAIGVEPAGEGERHTAMGDARWVMRIYDAVMGGAR